MPKKYHLETAPTPSRHMTPGPTSVLDWEEGCRKCRRCVRWECPYEVFLNRRIDPFSLFDTADSLCKHCFQCVQRCPMRLFSQAVNPEYQRLGDVYWIPDILSRIYYQAETGMIPVSGAGYGGRFTGPGFDSMWTDMSEIVRPTRDGIHGREYISTSVDIGRKPEFVEFTPDGDLVESWTGFIESPLPFILDAPRGRRISRELIRALIDAAQEMEALVIVPAEYLGPESTDADAFITPHLTKDTLGSDPAEYARFRMVQADYWDGLDSWLKDFRETGAKTLVVVRLPFAPGFTDNLEPLVRAGVDALHLYADSDGGQPGLEADDPGRFFIKDLVRSAHLRLVDLSLRDEVTLLVSGGLALAEHVAKVIICGADAVVLDQALWAAMECRLCTDCLSRETCPVAIESIPLEFGKQRLINLVGAWRNQLLEVLGAMGLREIRRLRGEVGRAMFFEQLEEESFAPIFGQRKG